MTAVAVVLAMVALSGCGPAGDGTAASSTEPSTTTVVTTPPSTAAPDLSPVAPAGDNPPYEGSPGGPRVAVLGDSLLTDGEAGGPLDLLLRTDHRTSRVATFGARADEMVPTARAWDDTADIAVVGLGANDAIAILRADWNLALTYEAFAEISDAFTGARCVVYVTIDEQAPCFDCDVAAQINGWWEQQALARPDRFKIADWAAAENARGGWEELTRDGLHETDEGRQLMAEVIDAAVRTCP